MKTHHLLTIALLPFLSDLHAKTTPATPAAAATVEAASTPDDALARLRSGNERFASGLTIRRDLLAEAKATSGGQKPFAVILSCLDSRTSPELIFDQGIGDIFSARLAGNVVDDDVLGSFEFATKVVGAKLIAVIGHSSCGAVKGAIDKVELGHLTGVLAKIQPAVQSAEKEDPKPADLLHEATVENVRLQMKLLTEKSPILAELVKSGALKIVGGVQDLASGKVEFLED